MKTRAHEILTTRAAFVPTTVDAEARTVELVWTTGAAVQRYSWDGPYYERLRVDEAAIDLGRLSASAPLLRCHNVYDLDSVIGVVERAWIDGDEGKAVVRFAKDEAANAVFAKVVDGILRNVSVGYFVLEMVDTEDEIDGIPVREVSRWEPYELSIVPVGADAGAQVRAHEGDSPAPVRGKSKGQDHMATKNAKAKKRETEGATEAEAEEERAEGDCECAGEEGCECDEAPAEEASASEDEERSVQPRERAAREQGIREERFRQTEIRSAVRKAKLPDSVADELINKGTSVAKARKVIIDRLADEDRTEVRTASFQPGANTHHEAFRSAVAGGILHRAGTVRTQDGDALAFATSSLIDIAKECLARAGKSTRGSSAQIAQRALIETSDLSSIMALVAARTLRKGYEAEPRTFATCFRQAADISNFKNVERHSLGSGPELALVPEGGTYDEGTLAATKETWAVRKYGKILAVTWESMVNDDLDALARRPQLLGAAAARKENDIAWGILTANGALSDTVAIFHATRDNLVDDVLDAEGLEAARKYFRTRSTTTGEKLNLTPKFLIVGPDLESTAEKLLAENLLIASQRTDILVAGLRSLSLVVEPRIEGTNWYVAADPNAIDTIEYGYLAGENGVVLEEHRTFDVDDLKLKARLVFGAGCIDRLGLYHSTGDAA
jgi:hypothetical protein